MSEISVLELPLVVEKWQDDLIIKKMKIAKMMYNQLLKERLTVYEELKKTREWRALGEIIREELSAESENEKRRKSDRLKAAYDRRNQLLREAGFSEYDFGSLAIAISKYYNKHISSKMAQLSVGGPTWKSFEALLFKNGEKCHFKSARDEVSLVSDGKSGITVRVVDGVLCVVMSNSRAKARRIVLPFYLNRKTNTEYVRHMLKGVPDEKGLVRQVRIVHKEQKGADRFYVQLTLARAPYCKLDDRGEPIHRIGSGRVGLAFWRGKIAAVSAKEVYVADLCAGQERFDETRVAIQKKMDELRRLNNPDNFNEDGTVKNGIFVDGKKMRLKWHDSIQYKELRGQLSELYRVHTEQKRLAEKNICYHLLGMGNEFYFAEYSFATEKPPWDEDDPETHLANAEYRKKKERRKSIQNGAPATFFTLLNQKLEQKGCSAVTKVSVDESYYWYRHDIGANDKELMNSSILSFNGVLVPQTVYRAFLIPHFNDHTYDQENICKVWPEFIKLF